jgi:hypothetical protein
MRSKLLHPTITAHKPKTVDQNNDDIPGVRLVIEHSTTTSLHGMPWPPTGADGWHLVRSTGDRTTWRRIQLLRT